MVAFELLGLFVILILAVWAFTEAIDWLDRSDASETAEEYLDRTRGYGLLGSEWRRWRRARP